jgi:hypothetical protein
VSSPDIFKQNSEIKSFSVLTKQGRNATSQRQSKMAKMRLLGVVAVLVAALVGWNCRDITTADLPLAVKQWKASGNYFLFEGAAGPRVIWHRVIHNHGAPPRTLICLHGFPTSSYDWIKILPALQHQFEQIILFDLLGTFPWLGCRLLQAWV